MREVGRRLLLRKSKLPPIPDTHTATLITEEEEKHKRSKLRFRKKGKEGKWGNKNGPLLSPRRDLPNVFEKIFFLP